MRNLLFGIFATVALTGASAAAATEFTGTTMGCFGLGCTPVASTSFNGLSFNSGSFDQFSSAGGFAGIGGQSGSDTLGLLSQNGGPFDYTGTTFSLLVNFSAPAVTSGTFAALLMGDVTGPDSGGAQFNFLNPTQTFAYPGGTFSLTVNSFSVSGTGADSPITGYILDVSPGTFNSGVPEPATWGMMLLGFAGVGVALRRRRYATLAQIA